jgi:acyl-CoA reductase-like NAD-dependent aldehyde dehydrogenase
VTAVTGIEVSTDHYIGGRRVPSERRFATISPIDESVLAEVARAGEEEVDLAVRAAHDAFEDWAALGPAKRA